MRIKAVLVICLSLILSLGVGCSPKVSPEGKVVVEYFDYLQQGQWEKAYGLLSNPAKDKVSKEAFKEWTELAASVKETKGIEVLQETKVTDFGDNTDMVVFDEVKVVLAEVKGVDKTSEKSEAIKENVHIVVGQNNGDWQIYLEKLEKAPYHKKLGEKYQREKEYAKAIAEYQKALAEDGDDIWVKYHLAQNLAELNKLDEAIKLMEEVIQQNEMILSFTPVEELKSSLIEEYAFLIELLNKKGDQQKKVQEYSVRIEELKLK